MRRRELFRYHSIIAGLLLASVGGCGAPGHAPAADDATIAPATKDPDPSTLTAVAGGGERSKEGSLIVATRGGAPSYLGQVHAVVRDMDGNVVAGADEEQGAASKLSSASELSLGVPAGEGFTLELRARTVDPVPSDCEARISPLAVEAGVDAHLHVLAWQCGDRTGYVPPSTDSECYWLLDWMSVARLDAASGEGVAVKLQVSEALKTLSTVRWEVEPPTAGHFVDPASAETIFSCDEASPAVRLRVTAALGSCVEQLAQPVVCKP